MELLLNECRQRAQALKRNANLTFYGIIDTKIGKNFLQQKLPKAVSVPPRIIEIAFFFSR